MTDRTDSSKCENPGQGMTTGHACLIAKALNQLVAMGSSRPRTLAKLCKVLEPCTAVVPYLNPIHALTLANELLNRAPPLVELTTRTKVYTSLFSADQRFWEVVARDICESGRYFIYPPDDIEPVIFKKTLRWLRTNAEGTEESLLEEFYQQCWMEQDLGVGSILEGLQKTGFLHVNDHGAVSYSLPAASDLLDMEKFMDKIVPEICKLPSPWRWAQYGTVQQASLYHAEYYTWNPPSTPERDSFRFGDLTFPLSIQMAEIRALFQLSKIMSADRPRQLSDLRHLLKPVSKILYLIPPSIVLKKFKKLLPHRLMPGEGVGQKRRHIKNNLMEFAIGVSRKSYRIIPLTPEGLLGIIEACGHEGASTTGEADASAATDLRQEITGKSRQFTSMLVKRLTLILQQQSAVLVQATEEQKREIVAGVAEWVERYCSNPLKVGTETGDSSVGGQSDSQPTSMKELQQELLARCTVKMTRIPALAIATLLEEHGYISVDRRSPTEPVSYLIPQISKETPLAWQNAAAAYWETSVRKCYSRILDRHFPPKAETEPPRSTPTKKARKPPKNNLKGMRNRETLQQSIYNVIIGFTYGFVGGGIVLIIALLISQDDLLKQILG